MFGSAAICVARHLRSSAANCSMLRLSAGAGIPCAIICGTGFIRGQPMPFGAHMSISGGVGKSFARGASIGIEAMQIFAKNERQWQAKPYADADVAFYKTEAERTGI